MMSYGQAHRLHRAALAGRGCEHCGQLEVALRHDTPPDRLLVGTGRYAGLLFTTDSDFMIRLCSHHHRLYDSRGRRISARSAP